MWFEPWLRSAVRREWVLAAEQELGLGVDLVVEVDCERAVAAGDQEQLHVGENRHDDQAEDGQDP